MCWRRGGEPVPLLRDLGVVKRLFAVDRIRVWLTRQLLWTTSIVLWVVVRVRTSVFRRTSAQENHSNTKHTQTLRLPLWFRRTSDRLPLVWSQRWIVKRIHVLLSTFPFGMIGLNCSTGVILTTRTTTACAVSCDDGYESIGQGVVQCPYVLFLNITFIVQMHHFLKSLTKSTLITLNNNDRYDAQFGQAAVSSLECRPYYAPFNIFFKRSEWYVCSSAKLTVVLHLLISLTRVTYTTHNTHPVSLSYTFTHNNATRILRNT